MAGTAPPKPGSYIPPWLKPIPINTRDVLALLRRLLSTREPRLARWLYSTLNAQGSTLKYQEIRNAIRDGQLSEEVLERWRQEYASLVAMRLEPYQRELLAAMDRAANPALVLTPTATLMGDALRARNWGLIKDITDEQRNAVRAVMAYQAVREVPLTVNELAQVLRPVVGLTQREAKAVLRWREQLVAEGYSARSIEHSVQNYSGFLLRRRADRIARTESCWAFNRGQLAQVQNAVAQGVVLTRVRKRWASAEDEMTCPECGDVLNGEVRELEEQFSCGLDFPPAHPSCLPGDVLVLSCGGVSGSSERWYEGDLVIVSTAAGHELSCTPNHPVLTDRGWIAAGALNVGGYVVSLCRSNWKAMVHGDHEHVPARIEQVARALDDLEGSRASTVPTSSEDFHGDGVGSEIAVVRANRELRDSHNAAFGQECAENVLAGGGPRGVLSADGGRAQGRKATPAPASRGMGVGDLTASLGGGHALPLEGLALALVSRAHAILEQDTPHGAAADIILLGDGVLGFAGEVQLDRIVGLRRRQSWSGHVFNLQTMGQVYIGNGLVVHNCRCGIIYEAERPADGGPVIDEG